MQQSICSVCMRHDDMHESKLHNLVNFLVVVISPGLLLYTRLVYQLADGTDPDACKQNKATRMALDSVLYDKLAWDLSVAIYLSIGRAWFLYESREVKLVTGWFFAVFWSTMVGDVSIAALALAGTSLCNGERPVVIATVCAKQELSDYVSRCVLIGSCGLLCILFGRTCLQRWKLRATS